MDRAKKLIWHYRNGNAKEWKVFLEEGQDCFTFKGFNGCFKIASIGKRKSCDLRRGMPSIDLIWKQRIYIMACTGEIWHQENKATNIIDKKLKNN